MAAKASWHRYVTKLRHCHSLYGSVRDSSAPRFVLTRFIEQLAVYATVLWIPIVGKHNVTQRTESMSQSRRRRIESRPLTTCVENLVKFRRLVFEVFSQIYRQTDRHTAKCLYFNCCVYWITRLCICSTLWGQVQVVLWPLLSCGFSIKYMHSFIHTDKHAHRNTSHHYWGRNVVRFHVNYKAIVDFATIQRCPGWSVREFSVKSVLSPLSH